MANAVQANLLAATSSNEGAANQVYNVALNQRTTLNQLFSLIRELIRQEVPGLNVKDPIYRDFRPGDVQHSQADIRKAAKFLNYSPTHDVRRGLAEGLPWYQQMTANLETAER